MMTVPDFLKSDSGVIPIRLLASRDLEMDIHHENGIERPSENKQSTGKPEPRKPLVDTTILDKKVEELSLGVGLKVLSPNVLQPSIKENESHEKRIRRIVSSQFYKEVARAFEESRKPEAEYGGTTHSIDVSPEVLKKAMTEIDPAAELVLLRLKSVEQRDHRNGQKSEG